MHEALTFYASMLADAAFADTGVRADITSWVNGRLLVDHRGWMNKSGIIRRPPERIEHERIDQSGLRRMYKHARLQTRVTLRIEVCDDTARVNFRRQAVLISLKEFLIHPYD